KADYVFLYDPWWNPAVENQAIDRTHRLGQDKTVMAYRLVAKDTIEERVLALMERKRELFEAVVGEASDQAVSTRLTREDLLQLLS
ncbi:MAG: DEAD/DEAH box helicase, partial [Lentisphaeria bacterium]